MSEMGELKLTVNQRNLKILELQSDITSLLNK